MDTATDRFAISCQSLIIGHSGFEQRGLPRGVIAGAFSPTREYESVRHLFRADVVARVLPDDPDGETVLRAYYRTRDRLRFEVFDPKGAGLPVEYVHVYEPLKADEVHRVVARFAVSRSRQRMRMRWFRFRPDA